MAQSSKEGSLAQRQLNSRGSPQNPGRGAGPAHTPRPASARVLLRRALTPEQRPTLLGGSQPWHTRTARLSRLSRHGDVGGRELPARRGLTPFSDSRGRRELLHLYDTLTERGWCRRGRPGSQSNAAACPGSREGLAWASGSASGRPRCPARSAGDSSKAPGSPSLCGSQTQGGYQPHSTHEKDATARHGGRGPGGETQMPCGHPGARRPPRPSTERGRLRKLTAAGPGGLLPAAGPVQARGWRQQASGLFQDARLGPAAGRAMGRRRGPRDSPSGWHEGD